jgi:hypothetical protein
LRADANSQKITQITEITEITHFTLKKYSRCFAERRLGTERRPRARRRYEVIENPMNSKKSRLLKAAKGTKHKPNNLDGEAGWRLSGSHVLPIRIAEAGLKPSKRGYYRNDTKTHKCTTFSPLFSPSIEDEDEDEDEGILMKMKGA